MNWIHIAHTEQNGQYRKQNTSHPLSPISHTKDPTCSVKKFLLPYPNKYPAGRSIFFSQRARPTTRTWRWRKRRKRGACLRVINVTYRSEWVFKDSRERGTRPEKTANPLGPNGRMSRGTLMVNDLRPARRRSAAPIRAAENCSNFLDNAAACRRSRVFAAISRLFGFITASRQLLKSFPALRQDGWPSSPLFLFVRADSRLELPVPASLFLTGRPPVPEDRRFSSGNSVFPRAEALANRSAGGRPRKEKKELCSLAVSEA